jgi:hypothetical protein
VIVLVLTCASLADELTEMRARTAARRRKNRALAALLAKAAAAPELPCWDDEGAMLTDLLKLTAKETGSTRSPSWTTT